MIRLLQFLNEKNHFLEKFYALNEAQILKMEKGLFDELEVFYNQREDLLKIIKYIDAEIHNEYRQHKNFGANLSTDQKTIVRDGLRVKQAYVSRILEQDLKILGMIDDAKSTIIKELQQIQKGRRALNGYRTPEAQ